MISWRASGFPNYRNNPRKKIIEKGKGGKMRKPIEMSPENISREREREIGGREG
jgi:hypothetical protein